jgi:hypothetical protein
MLVEMHGLGTREPGVQILVLQLTHYVALGKSLHLSQPQLLNM